MFMMITGRIPVVASGTSVVIRRLLEHFSEEDVVVVGRDPGRAARSTRRPHYRTVVFPGPTSGVRGERYWLLLTALVGIFVALYAAVRFRPRAIVAVYPDDGALLIGYVVHLVTRIPVVPYLGDLYMEERRHGWQAQLARWLQPRLFRRAARVAVVNQGMADFYRTRYGLSATEIPTCINDPIPEASSPRRTRDRLVIAYSGNINETRLPLLRELTRAVGGRPAFEIRYFTPARQTQLEAAGLWADNVSLRFVEETSELIRQLGECDVLYLPLTFETTENTYESMSTCFGIKAYEYFLAQRPIILQSPDGYFITRFFSERSCGYVITQPTADALRAGIERLRTDERLRETLVANALVTARAFGGMGIAARMRALLSEVERCA